uniref:UPAR/Ly6 domain-containing protein n=2 Tax=Anas TaxID=8835 RepID=A0A8B9VU52_9AVES
MKALLLAALAAVLCVERAHTLVCFSCSDASSNWGCLKPVTCGENENYCVTTYVGVGLGGKSGQSISKGCSPICPSAGINVGIAAASVYCCDSFLCNISGSSNVKASYTVLALGILVSFFYILRARLRGGRFPDFMLFQHQRPGRLGPTVLLLLLRTYPAALLHLPVDCFGRVSAFLPVSPSF